MVKLYIEKHGTAIAIGIKADSTKEILEQFNSFWNHGATGGELIWKDWDFAFFWTTPAQLETYLVNSSLHRVLNENPNGFKGKKGGAMAAARELAQKRKENDFTNVNCLYENQTLNTEERTEKFYYNLGEHAAGDSYALARIISPGFKMDFGGNAMDAPETQEEEVAHE